MSDRFRRIFIIALLALVVGAPLLETSGRWDRTFNDADDEAGVVAVVLCVGVALCAAGSLLARIRYVRVISQVLPTLPLATSIMPVKMPGLVLQNPESQSLRI